MPVETHQLGRDADTACVVSLLWAAVREELGERGLGPEIDSDVLDPNMTVTATMASLLAGGDHGD